MGGLDVYFMGCRVGWQGGKVDSILIARVSPDRPKLQVRLIGPLNKSEVQSHVPWSCSHQVATRLRLPRTSPPPREPRLAQDTRLPRCLGRAWSGSHPRFGVWPIPGI